MPTTCVITGYKLGAGTIILYGFILSGSVYQQPNGGNLELPYNITPINSTPKPLYGECGKVDLGAETRGIPLTRFAAAVTVRRILGGVEAKEGDWPWMAYLYHKFSGPQQGFFCGGSLINERWIVTAAHCISRPNSPETYGIVLGEHNSSDSTRHERFYDVELILRHDDFAETTFDNDIALMKVSEVVQYSRYIRPVCLVPRGFPTDSTENQEFGGESFTFAGNKCSVLGWGRTETGSRSEAMQELEVVLLPRILCSAVTASPAEAYHGRSVEEEDKKFCAGGSAGEDTCAGDSGGPLLCLYQGSYYLHGLTSYGTTPCGQPRKPGVYTKLTDYYDWITSNAIV